MKTRWERIEQILFVLYLLLMLWLLFGQRAGAIVWDEYAQSLKENCNLIPFRTIESYLRLVASASSLTLRRHAEEKAHRTDHEKAGLSGNSHLARIQME